MYYYFLNLISEVSAKKNSRPEKRQGGGGYGYYKNLNVDHRDVQKARVYRQPNMKKYGRDRRQFAR